MSFIFSNTLEQEDIASQIKPFPVGLKNTSDVKFKAKFNFITLLVL